MFTQELELLELGQGSVIRREEERLDLELLKTVMDAVDIDKAVGDVKGAPALGINPPHIYVPGKGFLNAVTGSTDVLKVLAVENVLPGDSPDYGTGNPNIGWLRHPVWQEQVFVDLNRNGVQDPGEPVTGDCKLWADMGVNVLRLYHGFGGARDYAIHMRQNYGFGFLFGHLVGAYGIGCPATTWREGVDYSNRKHVESIIRDFKITVLAELKAEQMSGAVLVDGWVLGNENTFKDARTNAGQYPRLYFGLVNELARWLKTVDKLGRPVILSNHNDKYLTEITLYCSDVDIVGMNIYDGIKKSVERVKYYTGKDVMITEFGCPARVPGASRAAAEKAQSDYILDGWKDAKEAGVVAFTAFQWMDGWWKNRLGNPYVQDLEGVARNHNFPGGWFFEEWFGICAQFAARDKNNGPFGRQLRQVYYDLRDTWNPKHRNFASSLYLNTLPVQYIDDIVLANGWYIDNPKIKKIQDNIADIKEHLLAIQAQTKIVYDLRTRVMNNDRYTYDLSDHIGWAIDFGKNLLVKTDEPARPVIEFDLIKEIDLKGDLERVFGIDSDNQREIRIKLIDHQTGAEELFELPRLRGDGSDTYIVNKVTSDVYVTDVEVSDSDVLGYSDLGVSWCNDLVDYRNGMPVAWFMNLENIQYEIAGLFDNPAIDTLGIDTISNFNSFEWVRIAMRRSAPRDTIENRMLTRLKQIPYYIPEVMTRLYNPLLDLRVELSGEREDVVYSYQAFEDDSLPEVSITSDGLADIIVYYGLPNQLRDERTRISVRYDLANNIRIPAAVSYYVNDEVTIVIDFYKRPVFMIQREELDKFITAKWHLQFSHKATLDIFDPANIKETVNFLSQAAFVNGAPNLPGWLDVERKEEFNYNPVLAVDNDRNLISYNGQPVQYRSALLKVFEMPGQSDTFGYINGGRVIPVGAGDLERIEWDNQLIVSANQAFFYDQDLIKKAELTVDYKHWMDFKGNVKIKLLCDMAGEPALGTYVYDINKYGIGRDSVTLVKKEGACDWTPLRRSEFRDHQLLKLADIDCDVYDERIFFFEITKHHSDATYSDFGISIEDRDFSQAYDIVEQNMDRVFSSRDIREKYVIGNSGAGRLMVWLSGYLLDDAGNLLGDPFSVTFALYNNDSISFVDAGSLNFGYSKEGWGYPYDPGKGCNSAYYLYDAGEGKCWQDTPWVISKKRSDKFIDADGEKLVDFDVVVKNSDQVNFSERGKVCEVFKLWGGFFYQEQTAVEGPKLIRTYFDRIELPVESTLLLGEVWEVISYRVLYSHYDISYDKSRPGDMLVTEIPMLAGILEDFKRIFIIYDDWLLPADYRLKWTLFHNGNFVKSDDNRDEKYQDNRFLPWFWMRTKEGHNRIINSIIGKNVRLVKNEDLPKIRGTYDSGQDDRGKDRLIVGTVSRNMWLLVISILGFLLLWMLCGWLIKKIKVFMGDTPSPDPAGEGEVKQLYDYAFEHGFVETKDGKEKKLYDPELVEGIEKDIEDDIKEERLRPMDSNSRRYFWEKYRRMVEAIFRPYIEDVLENLGFTKYRAVRKDQFRPEILKLMLDKGIVIDHPNKDFLVVWQVTSDKELASKLSRDQDFSYKDVDDIVA
ncbi:MAG: hypothetical protein ABIH71_00440, partial [Candidatus Omnitrophota bacterium]